MEMLITPLLLIFVQIMLLILKRHGNIVLRERWEKIIFWIPGIVGVLWGLTIVLILLIITIIL